MSSNKHTAGQWAIRDLEIIGPIGSNKSICEITGNFMDEYEAEANAKLIAAAPILYNAAYSALQAIYAMPKSKQRFYQYLINDLLNAIQKANGTII